MPKRPFTRVQGIVRYFILQSYFTNRNAQRPFQRVQGIAWLLFLLVLSFPKADWSPPGMPGFGAFVKLRFLLSTARD